MTTPYHEGARHLQHTAELTTQASTLPSPFKANSPPAHVRFSASQKSRPGSDRHPL